MKEIDSTSERLTGQKYVQKFTFFYCLIILLFSAYFTPQDFNLKVALIVNILFFLIGSPYWFKNSNISPYFLNVTSQLANAAVSVWTCSFLGPTSHMNLVAIPQFILVLMMFGDHRKTKYVMGFICILLLLLPLFPFVETWYLHRRMKEENLILLMSITDLAVLVMSTIQVKVIVNAWRDSLRKIEEDKNKLQLEAQWRYRLLNILSHDIKEPMVYTLQFLRKLRKEAKKDHELKTINRIENAQMVIREVISNVESLSSHDAHIELPRTWVGLDEVMNHITPWLKGRLEEKSIQLKIEGSTHQHKLFVHPEAFAYQIFTNLMTNAIKFSPSHSTITLKTWMTPEKMIVWSIQDEGLGISNADISDNYSVLKSADNFNNGLGIKIALTFSQKQNIKLEWISREITNSPELIGTKVLIQQIIP